MKPKSPQLEKTDAAFGADRMLVRLVWVFAEFDREQRSKAMKAGMERKKARRK